MPAGLMIRCRARSMPRCVRLTGPQCQLTSRRCPPPSTREIAAEADDVRDAIARSDAEVSGACAGEFAPPCPCACAWSRPLVADQNIGDWCSSAGSRRDRVRHGRQQRNSGSADVDATMHALRLAARHARVDPRHSRGERPRPALSALGTPIGARFRGNLSPQPMRKRLARRHPHFSRLASDEAANYANPDVKEMNRIVCPNRPALQLVLARPQRHPT